MNQSQSREPRPRLPAGPTSRLQEGDCGACVKGSRAGPERYTNVAVRYTPLGSPWDGPNVSYVHVLRVTRPVWSTGCRYSVVAGGVRAGGVYRVGTTPPLPVSPYWYCQDPTTAVQALSASTRALRGLLGLSAHPGSSHSAYPSLGQ